MSMSAVMPWVWCFVVGGALCVIAQLLIDLTKLTPARILVLYVVSGVVLTAIGVYEPLVKFAGCGATGGITTAIVMGCLMALLFPGKRKK